ncbi:MAG: hypothetical protein V1780_03820 [Chloroflexota bacterium]
MSVTRCATHPDIETSLRCGKCGKPICPRCLVQTPVGARCRECARLYRLPTYRVSTQHYLKAAGTGLGLALVLGAVWGVVGYFLSFFLSLLLAAGAGYVIGELVSRVANRKRGPGLAAIAGAAVVVSYLVSLAVHGGFPLFPFGLFHLIYGLLAVAVGVWVAVSRLR